MYTRRYTLFGAVFGILFPIMGALTEAASRPEYGLSAHGIVLALTSSRLLWLVMTAPFFLGTVSSLAGRRQDYIVEIERARRDGYLKIAAELFAAAQSLLSTVSSFSSMTAETAASVRETTATMGHLGQTATRAALTAETVIGVARQGERVSRDGLGAVETSTTELVKLADEVRGLSERIEMLNGRMRDIFEIASVVSYVADRSQRLAEHAAEAQRATPGARAFEEVVAELRHHAEDAKKASAQVKAILSEIHKAMLAAMTAAEVGIRRAEQGAQVAAGTGDTIRRLATALQDASQGAKEIATVAQQQDHGFDQVLKAMNEIYLATQETMTSTQAVATEAKALNDLASGLKRAVEV
ncbi:methyl-accepting chemotaxis protein [Anaeromyxobacter oryzisoli]|jgi:methyl-accepting chemotaxis protein|uniref:methyl-accepting chemotaxis protein n=1 Tax=Anaeromyxobacter oryzisoli TaxID=2925408 RepID=UPI001F58956A|nr:methyl-accepting chemotaxis protein [Anaeromyxobacter sp. SG63]